MWTATHDRNAVIIDMGSLMKFLLKLSVLDLWPETVVSIICKTT